MRKALDQYRVRTQDEIYKALRTAPLLRLRPARSVAVPTRITLKSPTVADCAVTWFCDSRGQPIGSETGYLGVNVHESHRIEDLWKEHRKTHPLGSSISEMPHETHTAWHAFHFECSPHPDTGEEYSLSVEELPTLGHVLYWTSDLMAKQWLGYTNWGQVIRAFGPDNRL